MALPTVLIVVAAGLGWMGWRSQVEATPTAPLLDNHGWIRVFTNDPEASVSMDIWQESNPAQETLPGFQWLKFNIYIATSSKSPLWWALTLVDAAAFPPGELPVSGTIPSVYSKKGPGYPVGWTYVQEMAGPIGPVYYVQQVDFPTEMKDGWGTTIIFGSDPEPVYNDVSFDLAIRVRQPLLQDVGEYVTISTPTLGRLAGLRRGHPPWRLHDVPEGVDPKLTAMLKQHRWYEPKREHAKLTAPLVGVRQDSGTPPIEPFRTQWAADDSLKIAASFSRPAEATKNQRSVFFAGVLVSLAASFLVWALELFLGPDREPVAPLQRRPRRSGSVKRHQ